MPAVFKAILPRYVTPRTTHKTWHLQGLQSSRLTGYLFHPPWVCWSYRVQESTTAIHVATGLDRIAQRRDIHVTHHSPEDGVCTILRNRYHATCLELSSPLKVTAGAGANSSQSGIVADGAGNLNGYFA